MNNIKFVVTSSMVNGQIYFDTSFTPALTAEQKECLASVNLSRGSNKQYRLDQLSLHNGTGADWRSRTDGKHSEIQESQYRQRVGNDLAKAWETSKANFAAKAAAKVAAAKAAEEKAAFNSAPSVFFAANGS